MHRNLRIALVFSLVLFAFGDSTANAQVTLYDNLGSLNPWVPQNLGTFSPLGPDRRYAQQFTMGNQTTLDQVTVELSRPVPGVHGSMSFEIWHDDGSDRPMPVGDPNAKIADLGLIPDVTQIPAERTPIAFDNLALSLASSEKYWVVANFSGLQGIIPGQPGVSLSSIGWGLPVWPLPEVFQAGLLGPIPQDFAQSEGAIGTNGAARAHAYSDAHPVWQEVTDVFAAQGLDIDEAFFLMSVRSIPEPSSLVLGAIATVAAAGIVWRRRRSASPHGQRDRMPERGRSFVNASAWHDTTNGTNEACAHYSKTSSLKPLNRTSVAPPE